MIDNELKMLIIKSIRTSLEDINPKPGDKVHHVVKRNGVLVLEFDVKYNEDCLEVRILHPIELPKEVKVTFGVLR